MRKRASTIPTLISGGGRASGLNPTHQAQGDMVGATMQPSAYDVIASEYYDTGHITSRNFDHATQLALRDHPFHVPDTGLVLELGAGRGRATEFLNLPAARIVQLDASAEMLTLPTREPSLLRVLADAQCIPLMSAQFAAVVGFLVDPFIGPRSVAEAHRMLVPGGRLLMTTPTQAWGTALRRKLNIDVTTTRFRLLGTEQTVVLPSLLHSPDELTSMLTSAGFRDISVLAHAVPPNEEPLSKDIEDACDSPDLARALPVVHTIRATR